MICSVGELFNNSSDKQERNSMKKQGHKFQEVSSIVVELNRTIEITIT